MTDENLHEKCVQLSEEISSFIDDELDSVDRQRIIAHLKKCEHCIVCCETLKRTIQLTEHLPLEKISISLDRQLASLAAKSAFTLQSKS
ncbi:zf-HC2 domain-containing protein [Desulfobacterales bacterium HSG17]|nr:zf-HC2 domain-containing protein [Desulfobacterales bacterium HSG17]